MTESLENKIRRITEPAYYRFYLIPRARHHQRLALQRIQKSGKARLCFIVSSLPMWRFQLLLDLLRLDSRFDVTIAVFPFTNFSQSARNTSAYEIVSYFESLGISCLNLCDEPAPGKVLKETANPDILFYPQPYNHLFCNDLDCFDFDDKLICYVPYAALTARDDWAYRSYLNDIAWRLFYPSEARKQEASRVLYNKGENICIVGEAISDLFSTPIVSDPWAKQGTTKKRVIWAPHYSIKETGMLHRDSFTWLSRCMWDIAVRYEDRIQFAFKPHPRLLSELYSLEGWGKEKADAYYEKWAEGSNTQLITGSYVELFKGSDAMIHDCGSFSVEYHFTGKPVMFTTQDINAAIANQNELGRDGILAHYLGSSESDIVGFIENTVLAGKDPMKTVREEYYQKYLRPPGDQSVAANIYNEILTGLGFSR